MDHAKINKVTNYMILMLIIVIVVLIIISIFMPFMYHTDMKKSQVNLLEKSPFVYSVLDKYIYAIKREKKDQIQKCIPFVKRKNEKVYQEYAKFLDENLEKITVTSIQEVGQEVFCVRYTINSEEENTVIMKLYSDTEYFQIYQDEKLESFK